MRKLAGLLLIVLLLLAAAWWGARLERKKNHGLSLHPVERQLDDVLEALSWVKEIVREPKLAANPGLSPEEDAPAQPLVYWGTRPLLIDKQLLVSYYHHEKRALVADLLDLAKARTRRSWRLDFDSLNSYYQAWYKEHLRAAPIDLNKNPAAPGHLHTAGFRHPLLLPGGEVVLSLEYGPLICLDSTGGEKWRLPLCTHHSLELDAEGNIWTCSIDLRTIDSAYLKEEVLQISPEGKVLYRKSIKSLLTSNPEHDYSALFLADPDQFHLNEVQPVLEDSKKGHWKKGDLFLSLRNQNAVLLYRPKTDQVVWSKCTQFRGQHDVVVANDSQITVFNNNVSIGQRGKSFHSFQHGHSQVLLHDFGLEETKPLLEKQLKDLDFFSATQGRAKLLGEEWLFVESTDQSLLHFLHRQAPEKSFTLAFAGRSQGKLRHLTWCRIVEPAAEQDDSHMR